MRQVSARFPRAWAWFWAIEPPLSACAWLLMLSGAIMWAANLDYAPVFLFPGFGAEVLLRVACRLFRPRIRWLSFRR